LAELEEKNAELSRANVELARANAHAADLMAVIELRDEEIEALNRSLSQANARAADLLAELETRMGELEAQNAELDAFARTVAHDLRGPIGNIVSYARLLVDREIQLSEAKRTHALELIAQTGERMVNVVDELLLLARLRSAAMQLKAIDLEQTALNALDRLSYLVDEYQAHVDVPESWPSARGYGPWVEEVWVNYLSNALKYGGRPPAVRLSATVLEDGIVRCAVTDNGQGLSKKDQSRLFTPFVRLDQVRAQGHGLGLSIVLRIVDKLGGEVAVESALGQGSTFIFTLPSA
jgi:signal transduction histidine kinase